MGCAEIISITDVRASQQWEVLRQQLHTRFDQWLDTLQERLREPPQTLAQVSDTVWDLRQSLTGGITETILTSVHAGEQQRTHASCPRCARGLQVQAQMYRNFKRHFRSAPPHSQRGRATTARQGLAPVLPPYAVRPRQRRPRG